MVNCTSRLTFFSGTQVGRVPFRFSHEAVQPWISPRSMARLLSLPLRRPVMILYLAPIASLSSEAH